MNKFQLVWWGWQYACVPPVFQFRRFGGRDFSCRWSFICGPVELRRWA